MSSNLQNKIEKTKATKEKNLFMPFLNPFYDKYENDELLLFTKNFASLTKDNLSVVRSLETLSTKIKDKELKEIVTKSVAEVKESVPLHVCFKKHINVFGNTYCSLIEKGEDSGYLDKVLESLTNLLEQSKDLKKELENTFSYVSKNIVFFFLEIVFLMAFVVPPISKLYERIHKPYLTELIIKIGFWFQNNVIEIFVVILITWLIIFLINKIKIGKFILNYLKLKIPFFGNLLKKYSLITYFRNLVTCFSSGINIVTSMELSTEIVKNTFLKKRLEKIPNYIKEEGLTISESFKKINILPQKSMIVINTGEESGRIDEMFTEIADSYEKESFDKIRQIVSMVKPIGFVFMSIICGTVLLAMFIPLLEIIKSLYIK